MSMSDFAQILAAKAATITRVKFDFQRTEEDGETHYNAELHITERPQTDAEREAKAAAHGRPATSAEWSAVADMQAGSPEGWSAIAAAIANEINTAFDRGVDFGRQGAKPPKDAS